MIGALAQHEIDHLLHGTPIGRLGLCNGAQVFVFPIAIGYDGQYLYGHSREGLKTEIMRRNPEVCIEVEDITSPAHWQTVIAHGTFEEITDPAEREVALSHIALQSESAAPLSLAPYVDGPRAVIVFRVRISSVTGRYERDEVFLGRHMAMP